MADNRNLQRANKEKNDEFYTQLVDIEKELKHYKDHFRNKTIFCNCDDPFESNFFKYFAMNFNHLGLKKLISTSYDSSPIAYTQLSFVEGAEKSIQNKNRKAYKIEITEVDDYNGDGAVDLSDVEYLLKNKKNTLSILQGDGDFRSQECIDILKKSDIVVTNPPFSLFREFLSQLMDYSKKFIIIGNQNAITYKEIFPYLKDNILWLGNNSGAQIFEVPSSFLRNNTYIENGKKYAKFGNICWFTNLEIKKRNEDLILYKTYTPEEYPKYDNYDAIEVSKVSDIPIDHFGVMGVPLTFLDKYNPNQFEIVGCTEAGNNLCTKFYTNMYQHIEGKVFYNMKSARYAPMIKRDIKPNTNYYTAKEVDGYITKTYFRIFIRRKNNGN
ncbi:MAG: adenine-specific methyltransferase EcoRI family protein [Clostridia bacterium]|nr:adenine-specific methyltransferase EcoRI family protein [Clostridia bacterium]